MRSSRLDFLQTHRFWMIDISPSGVMPFLVLGGPLYAFASITAPELTMDVQEINQMNSMWKDHTYSGGSAGDITLTRGVSLGDDTFYEWIRRSMTGEDIPNRNFLLIHYTGIGFPTGANVSGSVVGGMYSGFGSQVDVQRIPGRAWVLWGCIPVRYKAGTDFDANSADISIMELDMSVRAFEQFQLDPAEFGIVGGIGALV